MNENIQSTENTTPAKKSVNWTTIIIWVVVIGILALLGYGLLQTQVARPEASEKAPEFDMQFFNGYEWQERSTADLAEMQGKVVVLNFWASWCVECRLEAELLENTWRKYEDDDVVFLGIAYSDVEPNAKEYLKEFGVTYPNAPDLGTSISADYDITGVPETFFIDKNGVIQHVQIGPVNATMLNGLITKLMAEGA